MPVVGQILCTVQGLHENLQHFQNRAVTHARQGLVEIRPPRENSKSIPSMKFSSYLTWSFPRAQVLVKTKWFIAVTNITANFLHHFDVDCHYCDSYIFLLCLGSCAKMELGKCQERPVQACGFPPPVGSWRCHLFFPSTFSPFFLCDSYFHHFFEYQNRSNIRCLQDVWTVPRSPMVTEATVAVWTLRTSWQKGRALARKMRSRERRRCHLPTPPVEWPDMCRIYLAPRGSSWNVDRYVQSL